MTSFRAVGIDPVLLKGPVIRQWLYRDEPQARSYHDVDLLVAPQDQAASEAMLRTLGFHQRTPALSAEWPAHADPWVRAGDGAVIDLHRCIHGTEALPRERVWSTLSRHLEHETVAGVDVLVPDRVARTLHVALHFDSKDEDGSSPRADLERAAVQVDRETWEGAVELASELGIAAEMGTRLRAVPATAALADKLGLPLVRDARFEFRRAVWESGATGGAYAIERLGRLRGAARARYALQKLFPPVEFMRRWSPLAARGRAGLAVAYAGRVLWCAGQVPAALNGWRRARRRLR